MSPSLKTHLLALAAGLLVAVTAQAADPKPEVGPNKGKLIGQPPAQAEALISPEGILTITFLDAGLKPSAPGDRSLKVFAQLDAGRQPIEMAAKENALVSTAPLPKPEGYMLVVQSRAGADAKPTNSRFKYAMHICSGCKLPEYACPCTEH